MAQDLKEYGITAKILHWLIVGLLAAQYAIGWTMPHIGRGTVNEGLVNWHFSVGAAVLFFIVVRLAWRLTHPVAQLATLTPLEAKASTLTHGALYVLVLVMTVLGWAAVNSRGWTVMLFGLVPLPALAPKGSAWAHEAGDIHNVLVWVLGAFILLHVGAAAYHGLVRKDGVARRMFFARQ